MTRRKATNANTQPGSLITVGLDIGYGVVKALTDEEAIVFPSVMGHARELKFGQDTIHDKYPGDQMTDDHGSWFVGDLALSQVPTGELLRLRGRTANEKTMGNAFRLRLAKVAIGKLMRGIWNREAVHLRISTGLPVDHMPDAAEFKTALLGQHLVQTDCAELIANVIEVMVMPQPLGTVYANLLTENGDINAHHTFMRTGVVDVGTFTVDIALDEDGEFKDAESGSVESGVYTAQERIAALLERDHRQKMPYKIVEQVLRTGVFRASGEPVDYSEEVEEALAPLRSATLNLISEKWKRGATIANMLHGLFAAVGGDPDYAKSVASLMRLPDTVNTKPERGGVVAAITEFHPGRRYPLATFEWLAVKPSGSNGKMQAAPSGNGNAPLPPITLDYLASGASNGNRNRALFDAACQFRDAGYSQAEAEAQLVLRPPQRSAQQTIISPCSAACQVNRRKHAWLGLHGLPPDRGIVSGRSTLQNRLQVHNRPGRVRDMHQHNRCQVRSPANNRRSRPRSCLDQYRFARVHSDPPGNQHQWLMPACNWK